MVTSDGTQSDSNTPDSVDSQQIFQLIDKTLPFEACLYHQFLPLTLADNNLLLGMVNTEDTTALEYASRIASYLNYSLDTHPITSATHQQLLSAYLNYAGKAQQRSTPTIIQPLANAHFTAPAPDTHHEIQQKSTFILDPTEAFDLPLTDQSVLELSPEITLPKHHQLIVSTNTISSPGPALPGDLALLEPAVQPLNSSSNLAELQPPQLLKELLARVLAYGIDRLYFERQQQQGRILWSENGVLQSVLEALPLGLFADLIVELKQITDLPLHHTDSVQQVEIERLYHQNPIVLRLRIMPAVGGEEATLQVLQGATLKFYQQQQIAHYTQNAWDVAQELSEKIYQLHAKVQAYPQINPVNRQNILALQQQLSELTQQLQQLSVAWH